MKNIKIIMGLMALFTVNNAIANNQKIEVSCTHTELCSSFKSIVKDSNLNYEIKHIVEIVGDPHDFEPKVNEVKNLISSDLLIMGPNELNPWARKIIDQRNKLKLKTIQILINSDFKEEFRTKNTEALSHFWLYPKIHCDFEKQLVEKINALQLINNPIIFNNSCNLEATKIENEISNKLQGLKYPLVFTHDALIPLIKKYSPTTNVIAIKGSGHHHETSAASVKELYNLLDKSPVIWVIENNIRVPQNILSKMRITDKKINIESAKNSNKKFDSIEEFLQKVKEIND